MSVFVVQKQMRFMSDERKLVPRYPTIHKAEKWGPLEYILKPDAHPFIPDLILGDIHDKLKDFNDNDFLLLIGNPCLIGIVSSIAANYNNGSVNFLQWSNRNSDYSEIKIKMY